MFSKILKRITFLSFISFVVFIAGAVIALFALIEGGMYSEFVFLGGVAIVIVAAILLGIDTWLFKKYGQKDATIFGAILLFALLISFQIIMLLHAIISGDL